MAPQHPHLSLGDDEPRAADRRPTPAEQDEHDLHRLGEALKARAEDVLRRTVARTKEESGQSRDDVVRDSFERICTISTCAVAAWLAGGSPEAGREAGREAWRIFGGLVAHQAVPLNEVTKRCLRWRDTASEVLRESAAQLRVSPKALAQALGMLQLTLT